MLSGYMYSILYIDYYCCMLFKGPVAQSAGAVEYTDCTSAEG